MSEQRDEIGMALCDALRDIVERLRAHVSEDDCWNCNEFGCWSRCQCACHYALNAADEIELLRANVAGLEAFARGLRDEVERLRGLAELS